MAILKSYKCLDTEGDGFFDAWDPLCPKCGTLNVAQVFLKPPAMRDSVRAAKTRSNDSNLKALAKDFGMTNIKSVKEGESQTGYMTRNNAPNPEPRPGDAVMWGGGGRFSMASVLNGGAVQSVAGEPVGFNPAANNLMRSGPRPDPKATRRDHEGLKIE
jgi:hypothetical protein